MARRTNKHLRPPRPLIASGFPRTDQKADGGWLVQTMSAGQAVKDYLCPGCNQRVQAGLAHVVAWPQSPAIGSTSAVADRRHWHTACWARRR